MSGKSADSPVQPSSSPVQAAGAKTDASAGAPASGERAGAGATTVTSSDEKPKAGPSRLKPKQQPKAEEEDSSKSAIVKIAEMIKSGNAKNVVILTGAGISTSAGIPDFRSPSTGLYANLARLKLPFPEAVFELDYFRKNPKPFWTLAKELYPGKHYPTPTHYFFRLLAKHGVLRRVFTQNIDTLETLAGLDPSLVVEAHGSFASAHCLTCRKSASTEHVLKSGVRKGEIVKCGEKGCSGLVKPDIVFFGEGLPDRFFKSLEDLTICDLLIVIGTSLQVHPFASLPSYVQPHVPRLLINREPVGPFSHLPSSRSSRNRSLSAMLASMSTEDKDELDRDKFWEGDADDGVRRLAEELGWADELKTMMNEGREKLEREWDERSVPAKSDEPADTAAKVGEAVAGVVGTDDGATTKHAVKKETS